MVAEPTPRSVRVVRILTEPSAELCWSISIRSTVFLLAPVTRREDGQMYFDVNLGIIKKKVEFRTTEEIPAELKAQGLDVEQIIELMLEQEGEEEGQADTPPA